MYRSKYLIYLVWKSLSLWSRDELSRNHLCSRLQSRMNGVIISRARVICSSTKRLIKPLWRRAAISRVNVRCRVVLRILTIKIRVCRYKNCASVSRVDRKISIHQSGMKLVRYEAVINIRRRRRVYRCYCEQRTLFPHR